MVDEPPDQTGAPVMNKSSAFKRKAGWTSDFKEMQPDAGCPSAVSITIQSGFEYGNSADEGFRCGRASFKNGIPLLELNKMHKKRTKSFRDGVTSGWKWQKGRSK